MYGFDIINKIDSKGDILYSSYTCFNHLIDKFQSDKLFAETDDYIIILDGVILNLHELLDSGPHADWLSFLIESYEKYGNEFFTCFRGSFAGALYDKNTDKWVIYGDHLGTKFIYYSCLEGFFCCSSMMGQMYTLLQKNGIKYSLDNDAAKMLLTNGFMLEDFTLCKEVRKVRPGCYIVYQNNVVEEIQYYELSNAPNNTITEETAIERIDELFRKAVDRQFKKDYEYGYQHVCALSSGLDCRMTSFVAHSLGYTKQTNITFSQTDFYDDYVSKKMATDLGHDWIFKSLDYGNWLLDVDEVNLVTGGNVLYYGTAHGNSLFKRLNFQQWGILHSGQLGDVVLASQYSNYNEKFLITDGAYSTSGTTSLQKLVLREYANKELGMWYSRYLNGANNGQQNEYNFTETVSPFLDLDFLEYALSIPLRLRHNHYIYKKWILSKYPEAANYVWTGMHDKISAPTLNFKGQTYSIKVFVIKILKRIFKIKSGYWNSKFNMNPVGLYLELNDDVRDTFIDYYKYRSLVRDTQVLSMIDHIIAKGTSIEKVQLHTLMSALKIYFANNEY